MAEETQKPEKQETEMAEEKAEKKPEAKKEEVKKEETKEDKKEERAKEKEEKRPEVKKEEKKEVGKKVEEKAGKEFTIPLRRRFKKTARYRRTPKAVMAVKEFLARHMKVYDRDLKKIKLDKYLNEFIWTRGIRNPPPRIRIRAVVDGDFIRAELAELPERLKFRKEKLEKREKKAAEVTPKVKAAKVPVETPVKTEEEKAEEKEKKAAVVEAGQEMDKAAAKKMKRETKVSKQPKRQRRMALAK